MRHLPSDGDTHTHTQVTHLVEKYARSLASGAHFWINLAEAVVV